ncbi:hypothetical protein ACGIF2_12800 [Cellulomonas sp. P22]|uniref:hypothetical protein n=1 Tax=Cellulomonas sp. P22 TaxID=3373189 RepID=UPI0037AB9C18
MRRTTTGAVVHPDGSRSARTRTLLAVGALGATVLLLGSCATGPATLAVPDPAVTARAVDCLAPQVVAALGLELDSGATSTPHPDVPAAGAVPDGFTPLGVVECVGGESLTDRAGVWDAVTVRRLEGDLDGLLEVLARPSVAQEAGTPCPAAPDGWDLWLVDAMGAAIRAALPLDACGAVQGDVAAALSGLTEIEVRHYPVHLVEPREASGPAEASRADEAGGLDEAGPVQADGVRADRAGR